jgi:hypothetical protein
MLRFLQVFAVMLVALAMAPAVAHALELPGKMRLSKEQYVIVQPIYYPGFTIAGGVGEAGGFLVTLLLLFLTPPGTAAFWLVLLALIALAASHATYWVLTHPVNKFWLEGQALHAAGAGFFSFDPFGRGERDAADWTVLRDRWEFSHVVRAGFATLSLLALVTAAAL